MPLKLILKQMGGGEIATITRTASGALHVEARAGAPQAEIEALVQASAAQPLPLVGGVTRQDGGQTVHSTVRRMVAPGDADFLRALAGALSKPGCAIQGKRVRAYTIDEP